MPIDMLEGIEERLVKEVKGQLTDSPVIKMEISLDMLKIISDVNEADPEFNAREYMQAILGKALGYDGKAEKAAQYANKKGYEVAEIDYMFGMMKIKKT